MGRFGWNCAAVTDVGRVRDENEDSVFCSAESGVFVVADGMGGHAAGEVASAIASEMIGTRLCALQSDEGLDEVRAFFLGAFRDASSEIVRQAHTDAARMGMGTTATVLVLRPDDHYVVGHIGDSRAYLLREGILSRITTDHSWVQEQVSRGVISPEQAHRHPQSNIITRALGTDEDPRPDIFVGPMRDGDRYLLSTDGLTDMVDEPRIRKILGAVDDPGGAAARMVSEANLAGGADNVTALVVHVVVPAVDD
ncbi:MAG: Stp1/IreP family PP2C-type Ser/Thr phosphatase [Gemmatimonadota bacterium]|nr:Stp1/IreP family PP2C-type Ser/Thr phosphatase [Gemmatimonadota bacterium]